MKTTQSPTRITLRKNIGGNAGSRKQNRQPIVDRLEEHARILETFPEAGAECRKLVKGLLVLSHHGYAVYYRIHDDSVTVERVLAPGLDATRELFR